MLNFGSAQVGGGGGPQYWQEVAEPIFNGDIMLENNNVNGVVAKANNTPVNYENIVSSWYDAAGSQSINIIGTIETTSGNLLSCIIMQHDYIQGNSNVNLTNTGLIQAGAYIGNNYEASLSSYDQGIYFNYIDLTRNLSMACVIQNDFNGSDMGWSVQSLLVSGYVFGIDETGKICTNQIDPTHTHTTPIGSIPIHDTNGVYQGKLLLY